MSSFNEKIRRILDKEYPHLRGEGRAEVEGLVSSAVHAMDGTESESDRHRIMFSLASNSPSTGPKGDIKWQ